MPHQQSSAVAMGGRVGGSTGPEGAAGRTGANVYGKRRFSWHRRSVTLRLRHGAVGARAGGESAAQGRPAHARQGPAGLEPTIRAAAGGHRLTARAGQGGGTVAAAHPPLWFRNLRAGGRARVPRWAEPRPLPLPQPARPPSCCPLPTARPRPRQPGLSPQPAALCSGVYARRARSTSNAPEACGSARSRRRPWRIRDRHPWRRRTQAGGGARVGRGPRRACVLRAPRAREALETADAAEAR